MKHILPVILSGLLFVSCWHRYHTDKGTVFRTLYQVKYQSNIALTEKINAELEAFNLSLNPFNPNSILAKVNRNEEVEIDTLFRNVFVRAMEVSDQSNGRFDVTAAPLINLWGFGFERIDSISPEMIDSLKTFVGYRKVRMEGNRIVKDDPRVILNFSAIAKGYACDVIAALLEREGVENYLVEIGGEITAKGKNARGICWQIAINMPDDDLYLLQNTFKETVEICNKSGMATSGNYRNYYIKDGKKITHTIDPVTGYPAEQDILSATVIAHDCMTADAYATAFMVMGSEDACRLAGQISEIDYYIIYSGEDGYTRISHSDGMALRLVNRK
ncbi:MAG: FAD:protein FMN transferase [Tannerella sp.]|jgi:thiamine biosynthesis lipoprotein|nr:FAD:protein FMN transferase [Tannerella sp.]